MPHVLTSKKKIPRNIPGEVDCCRTCAITGVSCQALWLGALIPFFLCCFSFPCLKLKGHAAGSPAAPSCGAFWCVMQMQTKTALQGEEKGKGKKDPLAQTFRRHPPKYKWLMNEFYPDAKQRKQRYARQWEGGKEGRKEGRTLCFTSVLWGELPHRRWQALVELVFAGDEGLADGLLTKAEHAAVAAHLVHEGLKHHPFLREALLLVLWLLLLRVHGLLRLSLHSRTHPPPAPTALPWAQASQRQVTHK